MKYIIFFSLLIIGLIGCKKHQPVPHEEVLLDLSTSLLRPNHEEFGQNVDSLFFFVNEIHNQNTNSFTILKAQEYFTKSIFSWNKINFFETENIANTYLHFRIQKWPVDSTFIQSTTQSATLIDSALIVNQSSRRKGLSAIEHLLFRSYSIDTLQSSNQSREYLYQTTRILKQHKNQLQNMWNATEYSNFETNRGSGVYTASNFF
ncbi:MAG: hypothetical protein KDC84_02440 [Crocinitomicaceae bacterium]|nr:hypothetical protein [Crocinitomicaceae bacterium]